MTEYIACNLSVLHSHDTPRHRDLNSTAVLLSAGLDSAVLAASLFHFGEYKIADAKNYLRERGVVVR